MALLSALDRSRDALLTLFFRREPAAIITLVVLPISRSLLCLLAVAASIRWPMKSAGPSSTTIAADTKTANLIQMIGTRRLPSLLLDPDRRASNLIELQSSTEVIHVCRAMFKNGEFDSPDRSLGVLSANMQLDSISSGAKS